MRGTMWHFVVGNHVEKELAGNNYMRGQRVILQMKMLGSLCCTTCLRSQNFRSDSARNTGFILCFSLSPWKGMSSAEHTKPGQVKHHQEYCTYSLNHTAMRMRGRLIRLFAQETPQPSPPQWLYFIYHHMLWCWESRKLESIMGRKAWQRWELQEAG